MLEVRDITRSYGHLKAVDQVSFSMGRGEIVGLLGHNGAGKTTIMKMLCGYLEPDAGRITIDGLDLATRTKEAQARLGYLPENLPVYPDMAVADYLDFAARLKGLSGATGTEAIRRAVHATDLGARLLSPIAALSRGLRQRVGVAQAILGNPGLLILDEPTNGLDPTQTEHMRELIRSLASDATVILSTHIMQEVAALCDRVLILRAGRLSVDARLSELRASHHLLLETSLAPAAAAEHLASLTGVEALSALAAGREEEPGVHRYRLTLARDERAPAQRATAARLARAVQEAGGEVYALHPQQRDLETLFREASQAPHSTLPAGAPGETTDHAA